MTKTGGNGPEKTDVKTLHERTITASLIGGADVDRTDVDIPDGAELRITKLSLIGGVSLEVRADVAVEVYGIRLGGVKDDGPTRPGGPTVRIDAGGLIGGVTVTRA